MNDTVLVISDRFPPDSIGGAEISLYSLLKPLSQENMNIKVATLSHNHSKIVIEQVEPSIEVYRIPFPSGWPPQFDIPVGSYRKYKKKYIRLLQRLSAILKYIFRKSSTSRIDKIKRILSAIYLRRSGLTEYWSPPDIDMLEMSGIREHLIKLIRDLNPILGCYSCWKGTFCGTSAR